MHLEKDIHMIKVNPRHIIIIKQYLSKKNTIISKNIYYILGCISDIILENQHILVNIQTNKQKSQIKQY